jgi:hypothetical protein
MCEPVTGDDLVFDFELIDQFEELPFEIGGVNGIGIETQSGGAMIYRDMLKKARAEHRTIRMEGITAKGTAKTLRILSGLQELVNGGMFHCQKSFIRGKSSLGEEFRTFPKGLDDCLDATTTVANRASKQETSRPYVYLGVDPAFTEKSSSDYSAIVAGCYYRKELWILEVKKFKTSDLDVLYRQIMRIVDKFSSGADGNYTSRHYSGSPYTPIRGASYTGNSQASGYQSFDCDLSTIYGKKDKDLLI